MKPWYQYRCEEIAGISLYLIANLFVIEGKLSKRLSRFLLEKFYASVLYWQFQHNPADWRGIYGSME